ncbi:hypothetical protein CsSME_00043434 [Camellia sinensis var. sinensis]
MVALNPQIDEKPIQNRETKRKTVKNRPTTPQGQPSNSADSFPCKIFQQLLNNTPSNSLPQDLTAKPAQGVPEHCHHSAPVNTLHLKQCLTYEQNHALRTAHLVNCS